MKILIEGGNGLLGTYLRKVLMKKHTIISPTKHELDISNSNKLRKYIDTVEPDIILNAAGMTNVYLCEKNTEKAFKINTSAPAEMARIAYDHNIYFIHFSTNFIFDGEKGSPYNEYDKPNPLNIYAKSKFEAEKMIAEINSNALIIRSAEIFGVGPFSAGHNIPYYIVRQLINRKNLNLFKIITSPTYARHIAERVSEIIDLQLNGILHLVNDGECSYFEIADMIFEIMKKKSDMKVKESVFDLNAPDNIPMNSILMKDLKITPMPSTMNAITEFIKEVL